MRSMQMLGLLVAAGAVGAVTGGLVATVNEKQDDGPDAAVMARLDDVVRGVESLREAAGDLRNDVADVRERLVAVELEMSRRANAPTPVVRTSDPEEPGDAAPDTAPEVVEAARRRLVDMERRAADMEAAAAAAMQSRGRFMKGMKIRAMPEGERWQYAADELGLNSVQVDELKAAHTELVEGLKEAIVEETTDSGGGNVMTFRRVDGNKMREVRDAFQARVDNALNDEQKKAWADEGFGHAFSRPGSRVFVAPRRPTQDGEGGATGTATIEIVTTESDD